MYSQWLIKLVAAYEKKSVKIKTFYFLVQWVKHIIFQIVYYALEVKHVANCSEVDHENMLFQ